MISVSIIIPAWNEERTLRATLEAILQVDYDKEKCEVLVVGGGNDNTYEIAHELSTTMNRFSRYIVIRQEYKGKNAAIQQGIKQARNQIIVLLDADTIATKDWLQAMVCPIEQGSCDLIIANARPVQKTWISDYYMITNTYLLDKIVTYPGHSIAFRANIVEGFLEYFFDTEVKVGVDYLLCKRFLEQGRKITFAKEVSVTTHLPSTLKCHILSQLRWLTAQINIDGVSYRRLACNSAVVGAMIFALIPFWKAPFMAAWLFNIAYVGKRTYMFLIARRTYHASFGSLLGFNILSYLHHIIGILCHMKWMLGLSKRSYLYQGQRY